MWNLETNECITALLGHTRLVPGLIVHNNKLFSGSKDKTICEWNLRQMNASLYCQDEDLIIR